MGIYLLVPLRVRKIRGNLENNIDNPKLQYFAILFRLDCHAEHGSFDESIG